MANQILKSEIKLNVYKDLGRTLRDYTQKASDRVLQLQGAKQELARAASNIHAMSKVAEQELDEGKIKDLEQLEVVKRFIARAAASLENQGQHLEIQLLGVAGKVQAFKESSEVVEKAHEREIDRVRSIQAMLETGAVEVEDDGSLSMTAQADVGRVPGSRPAATDIQQRKAEAAVEKAKVKDENAEVAKEEPKKARRRRRSKE